MALIECPECGKQVSSKAPACPGCGAPMDAISLTPKGGRIPYTDQEASVLLSKKKNTSHVLHLLLSVFTAGLWIIIWLIVAASNGSENRRIDNMIAQGKKV